MVDTRTTTDSPHPTDIPTVSSGRWFPGRRPCGSWLAIGLSAAFHGLLLIAGALWVGRPSVTRDERARPAGLAVVHVRRGIPEYLTMPESVTSAALKSGMDESAKSGDGGLPTATQPTPESIELGALPAVSPMIGPSTEIASVDRSGAARPQVASNADYSEWLAKEAAELRGRIPTGPPVGLSLFGGEPAIGRSFVFLLDRSKSMGGGGLNGLAAAARELASGLAPLEPVHRFSVVAYHHETVYLDGNRLLSASEPNKGRVTPFLNGLVAFGQTEHEMGLYAALRLKADVVYLFTDGGDPWLTDVELAQIHREAAAQRTSIHCIQFGLGPLRESDNFLMRLARQNRGGFVYVDMSTRN